ncbi:MAG: hypothetical protein P1P90_00690 [Patescibacteria group bacterium]|nr:hypothetical protein [Patescibacteria group bacterium]
MKRTIGIVGFFALLVVLGAGCLWFNKDSKILPAGPRPADLNNISPEEASKRINFVPGSQIEIRQTYLGVGAQGAEKLSEGDKSGVRIITIDRFAPMNIANLRWQLSQDMETGESITARADYDEAVKNLEEGEQAPGEPEIIKERQTVIGTLTDINLKNTHKIFLPAYWPTGESTIADLSAIWVSTDVFEELKGTKNSTIYFGILDSALFGALSIAKEFSGAIDALRSDKASISNKVDVDLVKADEPSEWELMVNGKKVMVQVIKARNWFGEIVVLDNPQNPLILKMTFSPEGATELEKSNGAAFLKTLLGYEVTQLNGVQ